MVADLIKEAARAGLTIRIDGDQLRILGEPSSPDLLERLRAAGEEIAEYLSRNGTTVAPAAQPVIHIGCLDEPLSAAEMARANAIKALQRQAEILAIPIEIGGDHHTNRLIGDTANQAINTLARASQETLRLQRDGSRMPSAKLLEAVARADAMAEEDRRRDAEKAAIPDP
jgi:hypothetical protein